MRATPRGNQENRVLEKIPNGKRKLKMAIRTTTSIHLPRVSLCLILLFVLNQVMPPALGQSPNRGSGWALIRHEQEEIGVDGSTPPARRSSRTSTAEIPAM